MYDDHLPPGVTGREDAFGPQDERTEPRECGDVREFTVWAPELSERLLAVAVQTRQDPIKPRGHAQAILVLLDDLLDSNASATAEIECPWSGDADVSVWNMKVTWDCPLCGAHHVEERDRYLDAP